MNLSYPIIISVNETPHSEKPTAAPTDFVQVEIESPADMLDLVLQGKTMINGILQPGYRKAANWWGQNVIFVDVDPEKVKASDGSMVEGRGMTASQFIERVSTFNLMPNFIYTTFSNASDTLEASKCFRAVYIFDFLMDATLHTLVKGVFQCIFGSSKNIDSASWTKTQAMYGTRSDAPHALFIDEWLSIDRFFWNFNLNYIQGDKNRSRTQTRLSVFSDYVDFDLDDQWLSECEFIADSVYILQKEQDIHTETNHEESIEIPLEYSRIKLKKKQQVQKQTRSSVQVVGQRINVDKNLLFSEIDIDRIPLLRAFHSCEPLTHTQKMGLVTNLVSYNGFREYFLTHLRDSYYPRYPKNGETIDERVEAWERTINAWKRTGQRGWSCRTSDCPCEADSPINMLDYHSGHGSVCVKLDSTERQLISVDEARKNLSDLIQELYANAAPGEIHIIKAPTGLGKTHAILEMALPNTVFAAPTHRLLTELVERYRRNGNDCFHYEQRPTFSIHEERIRNIERLQLESITGAIRDLIVEPLQAKDMLTETEEYDLLHALRYLHQVVQVRRESTVFCTHRKAFSLFGDFDTFIFDECPMEQLVKAFEVSQESISYLKRETGGGPIHEFLKGVELCESDTAKLTEQPEGFDVETFIAFLREHTSEVDERVLDLASTFAVKRQRTGNILAVSQSGQFPADKKVLILSATANIPVYETLFPGRVIVHEIKDVQPMGRIHVHPEHPFTRTQIVRNGKDWFKSYVIAKVKEHNLDGVITYKEYLSNGDRFMDTNIEMFSYFGATEGTNIAEGKNIGVFGTPNKPSDVYAMIACAIHKQISSDMFGRWELDSVEVSGYLVRIRTLDNPFVKRLHLADLTEELTQAVGRARTLFRDCDVHLFSRFPVDTP